MGEHIQLLQVFHDAEEPDDAEQADEAESHGGRALMRLPHDVGGLNGRREVLPLISAGFLPRRVASSTNPRRTLATPSGPHPDRDPSAGRLRRGLRASRSEGRTRSRRSLSPLGPRARRSADAAPGPRPLPGHRLVH